MNETIVYKVAICDLLTNSIYVLNVAFPYHDVDEVDAIDIADLNERYLEKYIEEELGLDTDFVNYTIFSDDEKVSIYGKGNSHIASVL